MTEKKRNRKIQPSGFRIQKLEKYLDNKIEPRKY